MLNHPLLWVHRGIELIVLPVVVAAAIQGIKHSLGKALLAIGRAAQQIYDASGDSAQQLLVVFQQFSIRLTKDFTFDWQVRNQDERNLAIRERVFFQADHRVTDPRGHDRLQRTVPFDVEVAPVFVGHHLFAGGVLECEVAGGAGGMVAFCRR